MPASRDKSQKITFVYSNLYSIYRKGVEQARQAAVSPETPQAQSTPNAPLLSEVARSFESGVVIKANAGTPAPSARPTHAASGRVAPKVSAYTPAELIGKRIARPASLLPAAPKAVASAPQGEGLEGLKKNLEALGELQARLRFMLKELEGLIKE